MTASAARRQRLLVRAALVAGMLLAALGLLAALQRARRGPAPGEGPALSRAVLRVHVVDGEGHRVPQAEVFVKAAGGALPAQARWSPEEGTLMLPRDAHPRDLRVTARGHRVQDVPAVQGDCRVVLERGLRLEVRVHDVATDGLPDRVRVMLRVVPVAEHLDLEDPPSTEALVDLMDNLGGAGPRDAPRGDFGYPVSLAQARSGVLLPCPGRYCVIWGLFELDAGTWFSLGDQSTREVDVAADGGAARLDLVMTSEALQATLDGLQAALAKARAR